MRRSSSRTLLLLGAVVALAVFLGLYVILSAGSARQSLSVLPTPTPVLVKVVVAKTDLPAYTVLTTDTLALKDVDESTVLTTTARTMDEVTGLMTLRTFMKDEPIKNSDDTLKEPGISRVLPKGQSLKAFGLALQEIDTLNQGITENDNIDLLWTREFDVMFTIPPAAGSPAGTAPDKVTQKLPTTKTLLQNIKVLRVVSLKAGTAQSTGRTINTTAGTGSASDQQAAAAARAQAAVQAAFAADAPPSMVLILALKDQDAEVIKFARENGKISVVLRAPDDTQTEPTTGITDRILVDEYKLVLPEPVTK